MPGEKCWSGAGCVNGARPVLRGFKVQSNMHRELGHPQGNRWETEKRSCTLNLRDLVLLAASTACGVIRSGKFTLRAP